MELIGENLGSNISSLDKYEVYYNEGDEGELRLYVSESVSENVLVSLENEILGQGVTLTAPIVQEARIISVKFRKEIAPLLIIALAVGAIIVGLLGWQIFQLVVAGIPLWVILIGGGALLYLMFASEPAKKAGGLAIQAGKVYIGKKVGVG